MRVVVIGGLLGVGEGSDCSCQMSCLSPPPPDTGVGGELHVWAPCVAIATKAAQTQGQAKGCALHAYLRTPRQSLCLKLLFHNPGLMFEPAV